MISLPLSTRQKHIVLLSDVTDNCFCADFDVSQKPGRLKKKDKTPSILKIVRWVYPKIERIAPTLAHRYFVRLFFTPLHYPVPEKELKGEKFAGKFFVEVAGKKVQCYSWGSGKPVVFIHGWAGRALQFRRFVKPMIKAGYKMVAFDGPAHGNSEGKQTTIREFEEALIKVYEKIGQPEAIVAHSFGGGAALYAAMNGLPVPRLINIASPTIGDEIIDTYLKAIGGTPATKVFFKNFILKTYGKNFDEFTSTYFVRHLPKKVDLLLIHDENDKEVDIRHAEELVRLYPSARLLRTSELGHTRILRNDMVINACVTFIGDQASATGKL